MKFPFLWFDKLCTKYERIQLNDYYIFYKFSFCNYFGNPFYEIDHYLIMRPDMLHNSEYIIYGLVIIVV